MTIIFYIKIISSLSAMILNLLTGNSKLRSYNYTSTTFNSYKLRMSKFLVSVSILVSAAQLLVELMSLLYCTMLINGQCALCYPFTLSSAAFISLLYCSEFYCSVLAYCQF